MVDGSFLFACAGLWALAVLFIARDPRPTAQRLRDDVDVCLAAVPEDQPFT